MKLNKKSAIYSVLIAVLVITGFAVYRIAQEDNSVGNVSSRQDYDDIKARENVELEQSGNSVSYGWVAYNSNMGMTLLYPPEWSLEQSDDLCCEQKVNVLIKSGGYEEKKIGMLGPETTAGARINIIISDTNVDRLDDIDRTGGPLGEWWQTNPQTVTKVGGVDAWQYEFTYEGDSPFNTQIIHNGKLFQISFDGRGFMDETESKLFATYRQVLDTVKFDN